MTRVALGLFCLSLCGCSLGRSPLATTWVLDPIAARAASETPVQAGVLSVERVRVPDWLDRPQLVVRGQDGRLELDESARWGEPLARGLQRVMAENLASLMPSVRVAAAPVPPPGPVHTRLTLDFVEAARQPDGDLRVEVRWEFQALNGESLRRGLSTHRLRGPRPGAAGTVAALNETLHTLAMELAEVFRSLRKD